MRGRALDRPDAEGAGWTTPTHARLQYTSINPTVEPLDNIHCRKAIEYAHGPHGYQTPTAASSPAATPPRTMLIPVIPGYKKFDLYPTPGQQG